MNTYTMDEIEEGKTKADFAVEVSGEMLEIFAQISGDCNPMHTDEKYARDCGMKDKVVYGMLISSFYSRLVGMYLPGKYCLLQEIKINFHSPVYVGDQLTVTGVVKKKKELFHRIEIEARIVNQDGTKVSSAKITVGVLDEGGT